MFKDNQIFISVYLDVRRKRKKDGLFPLRVRVKHGETTNYYSAGLYFDRDTYEKIERGKRLSMDELRQKDLVNAVIRRANEAASPPFSFTRFKRAWNNQNAKADVFCYFDEKIAACSRTKQYSTSGLYYCALSALRSFHNGTTLSFNTITPDWLDRFVSWMMSTDKESDKKRSSLTTTSMYLRCLRAIFNDAKKNNDTNNYPFSRGNNHHGGFRIPKPEKTRYPLSEHELTKLKAYQPTESEQFWLDMFMFSYYSGGMNIKDIALLEKTHFVSNSLSFVREKAARISPKEYNIPVGPEAQAIINRWQTDGKYLFPLINDSMDEEKIFKTIKFKVRNINKVLKSIAANIGINTSISTNTARHTFASRLAHQGAPIALISESMHHSNIRTTQIYLGKFPSDEKREWFKKL